MVFFSVMEMLCVVVWGAGTRIKTTIELNTTLEFVSYFEYVLSFN